MQLMQHGPNVSFFYVGHFPYFQFHAPSNSKLQALPVRLVNLTADKLHSGRGIFMTRPRSHPPLSLTLDEVRGGGE